LDYIPKALIFFLHQHATERKHETKPLLINHYDNQYPFFTLNLKVFPLSQNVLGFLRNLHMIPLLCRHPGLRIL